MRKGMWVLALLWLGCVGDDGTEVIGSYAPPGDTSSGGTQSGGESSEDSIVEDASSTPDGETVNEEDVVPVEDATASEDVQAEDVLVDAAGLADVMADATEDGLAGDAGDTLEADVDTDANLEGDAADEDVLDEDALDEDVLDEDALDEDAAEGETADTEEGNKLAFGETCTKNAECETKLCLEIPSGLICSSYCDDFDCPEGYSCKVSGGSVVEFCHPDDP